FYLTRRNSEECDNAIYKKCNLESIWRDKWEFGGINERVGANPIEVWRSTSESRQNPGLIRRNPLTHHWKRKRIAPHLKKD
ncbi:MAG: hypothetical protein ACJ8MO_38765, partial [Bacillus sp. (in: firmicutes)]